MDLTDPSKTRLFPTKTSFFIFWSYISLFVSQGLLITDVQRRDIQHFNSIVVVFLTESVKLVICSAIYSAKVQWNPSNLIGDIVANKRLLLHYLVPSILYCLYNNLNFINLKLFDLTTYYCLMQFRIVLTAILYQILFKRKLTPTQWLSLFILTLGCLVKQYSLYNNLPAINNVPITTNSTSTPAPDSSVDHGSHLIRFITLTLLLLVQMFCSCFAGVYNEYLLKDPKSSNNADVILQNIFMYLDSIFCNYLVYKFVPITEKDKIHEDVGMFSILYSLLTDFLVVILILNNAFSGLMASFFLKSLNSILKTFASALELFAIAFLAWLIFGDRVDMYTITALFMVSAAMIVYSKNPVSAAPPNREDSKDGFMLLPTTEQ